MHNLNEVFKNMTSESNRVWACDKKKADEAAQKKKQEKEAVKDEAKVQTQENLSIEQ